MTGISFSVVIPAYNARRTIERAIRSILKQTVSDLEVIVIENGSTDGTHEIVETIDDPRVILVRKEEKGLAAARNTGIQRARNDWIAFLDADDEWLPHHLRNAELILARHADVRWYCAAFDRRRPDGALIRTVIDEDAVRGDGRVPDYFIPNARRTFTLPSLTIVHKDVFAAVGDFSETISQHGEDLDLWFRIGLKYPAMGYGSIVAGTYYIHADSVTGSDVSLRAPKVLGRIMHTIEAISPEDEHRLPAARLVVSRWLDRWIRLCVKEGNRAILPEMAKVDRRLITFRVRVLYLIARWVPAPVITFLRKGTAEGR
ncbi:MAG: glycosyltransferase [Verrucomicrobia bacterium]|nr:glycosyltransferase [Verrucomicrobiota bacterium]